MAAVLIPRRHLAKVRRVMSLRRQPMSRGEIYERAGIDHIHHLDAALARLVDLGQVVAVDTGGYRWAKVPKPT